MAAGTFPLHCSRRVRSGHMLSAVLAQQSATPQAGRQQGETGLLQALSVTRAAPGVLKLRSWC